MRNTQPFEHDDLTYTFTVYCEYHLQYSVSVLRISCWRTFVVSVQLEKWLLLLLVDLDGNALVIHGSYLYVTILSM